MYYVLYRLWIIRCVLDIRGFGFGSECSPELIFGLNLDYWFGCPDTRSDPNHIHCHPGVYT
jgi:hypothetical protein